MVIELVTLSLVVMSFLTILRLCSRVRVLDERVHDLGKAVSVLFGNDLPILPQ